MNNEETQTQEVVTKPVEKQKRQVQTFDFADAKGVRIPAKMKCTCCGKDVGGYSVEVAKRIKRDYNDSWEQYQKTFQCFECKNAENNKIKAELNAQKNADKIEKAIKLLEENGFSVRKAEATKPVDNEIVTVEE